MKHFARPRPAGALPVFLFAAVIPLFLAGGALDASTYPKLSAACLLVASIPFWPRVAPGLTGPVGVRGAPILSAFSVFMAIQVFSLLQSPLPEEGIWTVLLRALPGAVALAVLRVSAGFPEAMRDLSRAATAGLLAQCVVGGLQYFDLGFQALPGSPYLPYGTLANKNVFAAWLVMGLPLAAFALTDASRSWRRAALVSVAAAAWLIAIAYSRTGWLILAGMSAGGTAAAFLLRGSAEAGAIRRALLAGLGATLLALMWDASHPPRHLAYRTQPEYGNFTDRLASIAAPGDQRNLERLGLWRQTFSMAVGSPWTGIGAGGWKSAYPLYAARTGDPDPSDLPSYPAMASFPSLSSFSSLTAFPASPHNDFLLIAAETGVPGLLAYMSVFGAAAAMLAAGWRSAASSTRFAIACLSASLGAYLADAAFNFPGDRAEPALLLGLVLGVAALIKDATVRPARSFPDGRSLTIDGLESEMGRRRRAVDLAVAALALGGFGLCLARWDAETHFRKGMEARGNGDWRIADCELSRADRPWYRMDRAGTPVSFYRATAALGAENRAKAKTLLDRAYTVNPSHIHVLHDLGSLEVSAGRFREGIAWYGKCLALRPDFTEARENLAAAWFNAGRLREAKETLSAIPAAARTPRAIAYGRKVDELLKERTEYE